MGKEKYLIISIFLLGMATSQSIKTECTTPKNEKGVCIKIYDCPILLTLLNQTNDLSNKNFIQKSFCGFEGKNPKVCCPLEIKLSSPPTTCGISSWYADRIVGGKPAKLGAWPWIAALGYQHSDQRQSIQWLCGGTLVSSKHVLTAAHCVKDSRDTYLTVIRLGELDLNETADEEARPLDFLIELIIPHSKYDKNRIINDIALLKLEKSVTFTDSIKPICLPNTSFMKDRNIYSSVAFVAGWGYAFATASNNKVPPNNNTVLMEVDVPIVSTTECKKAYSKTNKKTIIDDKVLCAGHKAGGKDSCWADSGGPLMWLNGNQYFLIGIVSYGPTICGTPGIPGVYTNVTSFVDWIHEKISS